MPCFEQCSGEPQKVSEGPPPPPKKNIATTKYNKKLIEHLTKNLFSDFDHGDKKYYESKPSDKNVSAEFESNAKIIFYVGMSLLILAVTTIFAKHFYSKWKKRPKAVKKEVKEAEQEEPVENNDQNENFNEPEIVQMPKV
uniref:Uncharacterized protein n=1 Tax=Panagrolaimus superbus TaxID=310955 RepID=A0A914YGD7_9BILA